MRSGAGLSRLSAEVERLLALFAEAGALRVEPDALQPADTLLDLYGEDIRARAFVTHDGEQELMLRPDFTVSVVQNHMAQGCEPARYAYAGPVWRRQQAGTARATEYIQAGFELFDGADRAHADAEVFALMARALEGLGRWACLGSAVCYAFGSILTRRAPPVPPVMKAPVPPAVFTAQALATLSPPAPSGSNTTSS